MMEYIDTHCHMVSRSTDDYEQMALSGCRAVTEPAFWAGFDRKSAAAFDDYFHHITTFEPTRAAEYGIQHYSWLCLNPKEGEDPVLTREVLDIIPNYLNCESVLGIGEIGLNRVTRAELDGFVSHVDLATEYDQMILIHTPHLEDKFKGTKHITETLMTDSRVKRERVLIDHNEEHTLGMVLDAGFWAGITLYPKSKTSLARAVDMIERFGTERICINSACDWGPSVPIAVPHLVMLLRKRGHSEETIRKLVYENPCSFLGQSPRFRLS